MKPLTIIKLIFVGLALYCLWWVWDQYQREVEMKRKGHEVGRVCEPPGHPVIANGVEWGCVGDPSYYAVWIPTQ